MKVQDIMEGKAVGDGRPSQLLLPVGVRAPPTSSNKVSTASALAVMQEIGDPEEMEAGWNEGEVEEIVVAGISAVRRDPKSVEEARTWEDWPEWEIGIRKEMSKLEEMHTWDLIKPPVDANIVGSCMVLHYKHNASENIAS